MSTEYTVRDATEETACDYCGGPLYSGDKARQSADEQHVFCSVSCENQFNLRRLKPETVERIRRGLVRLKKSMNMTETCTSDLCPECGASIVISTRETERCSFCHQCFRCCAENPECPDVED